MLSHIKKRDGREVPFDSNRIVNALLKAAQATGDYGANLDQLTRDVLNCLEQQFRDQVFGVEDIQDVVERVLIDKGYARMAKAYILYRDKRTRIRLAKSDLMDVIEETIRETDRSNANIGNNSASKMLQIGSAASKFFYLNRLLDEDFSLAHRRGDIHVHDLDYYSISINCAQIPVDKMLRDGFDTGHGYIRPPRRPGSVTALVAIAMQSSQNDCFGGQALPAFDKQLAPFLDSGDEDEIYQAMEALVYNLNSMHSRAGNQIIFSSINLGTDTSEVGRLIIKTFLEAYGAGLGRGENPIFPNVIFKVKKGVNFEPGDPNYDLFKLACGVATHRMNPTFSFQDSSFNSQYWDKTAYMGCRSRVMANVNGEAIPEGRGNLSFTTINLPKLAIKAKGDIHTFFSLLDETTDLVIKQLLHRYKVQSRLRVCDLPFLIGGHYYMGSEGLDSEDSIEPAIRHGTLAMGFIGLAEALKSLTGYHHGESGDAQALGLRIIQHMRQITDQATGKYHLNFTLFATPAEGLSGRFTELDKKEYGVIKGVTDREYYTNSFHVPVYYPISSFDKIEIEGPYHKLCNAGHISYVEMPSPPLHNPEAVESVIRAMAAADMGYAGVNYPIDFCTGCGLTGVIGAACSRCGSSLIRRIRRITGYLSTIDRFNDAKLSELGDRVSH